MPLPTYTKMTSLVENVIQAEIGGILFASVKEIRF